MPTLFFNSHPHKEDDGCWRRKRNSSEVFNSHPHKEDDLLPDHKYQHCDFSTHILTRRMTMNVATDDVSENFSTHILTRRMTICIVVDELISTFQLTSSQGGWPRTESICSIRKFFNSHPHKEDDFWTSFYPVQLRFFNSHPHKEDDYVWVLLPYMIVFSTHILTRRMTKRRCNLKMVLDFSTHILTRRMT